MIDLSEMYEIPNLCHVCNLLSIYITEIVCNDYISNIYKYKGL